MAADQDPTPEEETAMEQDLRAWALHRAAWAPEQPLLEEPEEQQ